MARDYFAVLGLTPGRYNPSDITSRFMSRREQLLADLRDPAQHLESRQHMEELHLAYAVLRDPRRQTEYLQTHQLDGDPVGELRALIAASLEDGLLRHSRRQTILARAAELGLNEFQAHLLIAQVQFGDEEITPPPYLRRRTVRAANPRAWARLAGVSLLALTMFLSLVHWLDR